MENYCSILGLEWDCGKENGNYYIIGLYWDYFVQFFWNYGGFIKLGVSFLGVPMIRTIVFLRLYRASLPGVFASTTTKRSVLRLQ